LRIPISIFLIYLSALAPTSNLVLARSQQQPATIDKAKPTGPFLPEDTPVRLRLMQNLTSKTSRVNDKVDFEVIEPVKVGDSVVIEQGATAIATVTRATPKKSFGRSGKLDVNIDYVRLANGDKVNLRAVKGGSGGSRTGIMTGAVVATAIVFFPAAPLFFFIKGKNIEIPKGTEITAYVAADTAINLGNPVPSGQISTEQTPLPDASTASASAPAETANSSSATVLIKSDPAGAEITVDDKFMGTTQSTLKLTPGEHTITIVKHGYKEWKRTITLNVGSEITLDAVLEKNPQP
jgi:hypothetical protein